jgi:hypothetical protein
MSLRYAVRSFVFGTAVFAGMTAAGCGGSDDDGSGDPSGNGENVGSALTLEEACAASCQAQAATNCPEVFPPAQCTEFCIDFAGMFPSCADAWTDINACMAGAPLFCDQVNGGAAVSADDCGAEIDALATCMG